MKLFTTERFIQKAKLIHKEVYDYEYDYSLVQYQNALTEVKIICPKHGIFLQSPHVHLKGSGCPKCRYLRKNCDRIKSSLSFILESKQVHGDLYDYSKCVYENAKKKVIIICQKHGEFKQNPSAHLNNKHGCPRCIASRGELKIKQWLEEQKISYKEQKTFSDCRNPQTDYPLKFDFYIYNSNILIEYDSEQHYRQMYLGKNHKTLSDLNKTKQRDEIKNEYVKQKNIKLLRIPYFEFQNIPVILEKEIYG